MMIPARARVLALATLAVTSANAANPSHHRAIVSGTAHVLSGARLAIEGRAIRLWGLDAPTNAWCEGCGERARNALASLVDGQHVWCSNPQRLGFPETGELDGDIVAECMLGHDAQDQKWWRTSSPKSVNMLLVDRGWALPTEPMRHTWLPLAEALVKAARKARSRRRGLWREDFKIPANAPFHALNPARLTAHASTVLGPATSLDGNRIRITDRVFALAAIGLANDDWCTGRRNRRCGEKATKALKRLVGRHTLTCILVDTTAIPKDQRTAREEAFCTTRPASKGPCEQADCWINWRLVPGRPRDRETHLVRRRDTPSPPHDNPPRNGRRVRDGRSEGSLEGLHRLRPRGRRRRRAIHPGPGRSQHRPRRRHRRQAVRAQDQGPPPRAARRLPTPSQMVHRAQQSALPDRRAATPRAARQGARK